MSTPDWRGALNSLAAAAAAAGPVQADGGVMQSIANQVWAAGYQFEQDFAYYSTALANVPAAVAAAAPYTAYAAQFAFTTGIIIETGGTPISYDTSLATLVAQQALMNTAIATFNVGDDRRTAAQGALNALITMQAQLGGGPAPPAPVMPVKPSQAALLGAISRANAYTAFLTKA